MYTKPRRPRAKQGKDINILMLHYYIFCVHKEILMHIIYYSFFILIQYTYLLDYLLFDNVIDIPHYFLFNIYILISLFYATCTEYEMYVYIFEGYNVYPHNMLYFWCVIFQESAPTEQHLSRKCYLVFDRHFEGSPLLISK